MLFANSIYWGGCSWIGFVSGKFTLPERAPTGARSTHPKGG